ncbi:MAG: sigma-70 family RNA polymerase sigma factor [Candidatus Eisenbacteria bacterium]|nr:sigma-70 family RNA polymerase sigma factor [Candidatus Eisenbacteria bacterium]
MLDEAEEAALLARARNGDREAFWQLAAPSMDAIFALASRMVKRREDAEDVVQETFLHALGALAEFRAQSRFHTWLHRIAVNQALMKLRKRRSDVFSVDAPRIEAEESAPVELVDWSESVLDALLRREANQALDAALAELPIDQRTVVALRDLNGLSNEEAAAALEIPIGAVKWRLEQARATLRNRVRDYFREQRARSERGKQARGARDRGRNDG